MVSEARLERVASGLAPVTPGWFIVNTADAAWVNNDSYGGVCIFESDEFVLQGRPDLTEYEKPNAGFTMILATGNRRDDLERVSRRSEVALRYDAGVELDTTDPERRGRWEVQRPPHWDELPWAD